ncbi:ead/Ea22-like family protein, partial [Salmonella enterica subsp. diarizonae]|nr:ead/Ea22-like family protein [Salmonella enterica subsp. diarizonae]
MTALNKQAREEKARESFEQWAEQSGALPWGILKKHRNQDGSYPGPHYTYMWHAWNASHEALLDEMEAAEKRIAEQREYYEGVIADGSKRIAELERSETQLINERDSTESALNDAYKAV